MVRDFRKPCTDESTGCCCRHPPRHRQDTTRIRVVVSGWRMCIQCMILPTERLRVTSRRGYGNVRCFQERQSTFRIGGGMRRSTSNHIQRSFPRSRQSMTSYEKQLYHVMNGPRNATSWNLTELTIFERKLCTKTKLGQRNDLQSMGRPGRFLGHSFRAVLDRHGMLQKRNRTGSACCRGCSRIREEKKLR